MLIQDLMTRSPVTVPEGARLSEVAARMAERDVGSVVVVDAEGDPVGIVTDRDIALRFVDREDSTVEEVMSAPVVAVGPATDIETCIERMDEHGVRRIVIVEDGDRLVGVVSLDDIVIHLSNVLSKAGDLVRREVIGVA